MQFIQIFTGHGQRTFLADRVTHLDNNFKLRVISAYFSCRTDTIEDSCEISMVGCAKAGGRIGRAILLKNAGPRDMLWKMESVIY